MTSPRSYDGVGYPSPSFSSGTPIYDSLVAERGVPQIAPINVPAALPPATYGSGYGSSYSSGYGTGFDTPAAGNLPALPPARLALGPGLFALVLAIGGYRSSTTGGTEQPDSALTAITLGFGLVPAVLVVVSLWWLRRYSLTAEAVAAAERVDP